MSERNGEPIRLGPDLIEAILFAAGEAVRPSQVAAAFGCATEDVLAAIEDLRRAYADRGSGLEVRQVGEGYRIYTRPDLADAVGHFASRSRVGRLSRAALETLAIVAYRQPITRGEIARIRGVNVDSVLGTLTERGLLDEVGHDPGPGRPPLYGTTPLFLEKIGLGSVSDLPPLASFAPDEDAAAEIERALAPSVADLLPDEGDEGDEDRPG